MADTLSRRDFMKRAGLSTVAGGIASSAGTAAVAASDRVRIGVIGTGRQGMANLQDFAAQPDAEVVAVCDVYQPNLDQAVQATQGKAQPYKDFRQVLDRKDIDAIVVATPDHWHALPTVLACQAGKDVYVEKPICTRLEEGKHMVEAARKYKRVVQVGTQQRSGIHFQKAVELVQANMAGKISFVHTWNYANDYPEGIGNPPDSTPPSTLDWDMWLGPAPKVPFNWNRFGVGDRWSTFRYFWDYAGGMMTDWGVHLLDIVQWAMKIDGPNAVTAYGGKWYLQDNRETPDTLQATFEYPGFVCVYETRSCNADPENERAYGIEFHGTEGTLFVDRSGFHLYPEKQRRNKQDVDRTASMWMESVNDAHFDHVRNFLDCVKTRRRPVSDIEIGHRSTSTCLLANVAYRSRERIVWDVAGQQLRAGGEEARRLLTCEYRAPWKLG